MNTYKPNRSRRSSLITLVACLFAACLVGHTAVHADYVGLNYRVTKDLDFEGETHYSIDLFVEVESDDDRLLMVFGDSTYPLKLSALNGGFHNHEGGTHLPHEPTFDEIFGDVLRYDTFVTIGTVVPVQNGPATLAFDTQAFRENDLFTLIDGSWYILPLKGSPLGFQHDPLGILVARLTVKENQSIAGQINIIGRTELDDAIVPWSGVFAETFLFTSDTVTSDQSTPIMTNKWTTGDSDGDRYAFTMANIGDVNGDEFDDLVVAAPNSSGSQPLNGMIEIWSGYNEELLYSVEGQSEGEQLGAALAAAGDVNGDGIPDIIAGAPNNSENGEKAGKVYILSGADGSEITAFHGAKPGDRFGYSVAGGVSLDGDNVPDFVIGAPKYKDSKGGVWLYSSDGTLIERLKGDEKGDQFGSAVAILNHVSRYGQVVVGAPKNDDKNKNAGKVRVFQFDGDQFKTELTLTGKNKNDRFGTAVASLGDLNNDGSSEFAVGMPRYSKSDRKKTGRVCIHSSVDGDELWKVTGSQENERLGTAVANAGDINCDGVSDVLIGCPRYEAFGAGQGGRILALSGDSGEQLQDLLSDQGEARFGRSFAALGNPYNYTKLALGAWRHQPDEASGMTGGFTYTTHLGCHATIDLSEPLATEGRVPGTGPASIREDVPSGEIADFIDLLIRY